MRITFSIDSRTLAVLTVFFVVLAGMSYVLAQAGEQSHPWSQIVCTGCVTSANIASGAVTSTAIQDGAITNADVSSSAAISGTKISPNFGSANVVTSGRFESTGDGYRFPDGTIQTTAAQPADPPVCNAGCRYQSDGTRWDSNPRDAVSFLPAVSDCYFDHMRLPSAGELMNYLDGFPQPVEYYWTRSLYNNGGVAQALTIQWDANFQHNVLVSPESITGSGTLPSKRYFCVR